MKTNRDIEYTTQPHGVIATIPAGTKVRPAANLPDSEDLFWAEKWSGMDERAISWHRNYGFLIEQGDVE